MKKLKRLLMLLTLTMAMAIPVAVPTTTPMIGTLGTVESVSAAVRLNHNKITLYKGQSKKLALTGTAQTTKWSSSNRSIVTVKNGKITGRKKGTAIITAKVAKKKYTCKVTVKDYARLTKKNIRLNIDQTTSLKVKGAWESSNPNIARVSKSGLIRAVNLGTCEISATIKYHRYVYTVKVVNPVIKNTPAPTPITTPKPAPVITDTPAPPQQQNYVWLSATGKKYHKIPNCGKMNPSKARRVSLEEALRLNYPPCDKCF